MNFNSDCICSDRHAYHAPKARDEQGHTDQGIRSPGKSWVVIFSQFTSKWKPFRFYRGRSKRTRTSKEAVLLNWICAKFSLLPLKAAYPISRMVIDSRNSEALRRLVQSGSGVVNRLDGADGFTLPGLMEVIVSAIGEPSTTEIREEMLRYIASRRESPIGTGWNAWQSDTTSVFTADVHGVRPLEFYRFRTRDDQTSLAYQLFQERFVRALKDNNFPVKFAQSLAGVVVEMTDNIVQHGSAEAGEYQGLAGYHVEAGYMAIGVVDLGQGVLASLNRSAVWEHLQTSEQALRAAVIDHASCRPGQPKGEGFRTVLKSLAERNCRMRFRSGDAALRIEEIAAVHDGAVTGSPSLRGLQLSICCALKGPPDERKIISA